MSLEEYQGEFSIGNAEKESFDKTECIFEILLIGSEIFLSKSLYERKNGATSITNRTQFRKEIFTFEFFNLSTVVYSKSLFIAIHCKSLLIKRSVFLFPLEI